MHALDPGTSGIGYNALGWTTRILDKGSDEKECHERTKYTLVRCRHGLVFRVAPGRFAIDPADVHTWFGRRAGV